MCRTNVGLSMLGSVVSARVQFGPFSRLVRPFSQLATETARLDTRESNNELLMLGQLCGYCLGSIERVCGYL